MNAPPLIKCESVHLAYDETVILSDVSLSIAQHEVVTILGGSGCGKTTLLRTLVGLLPPSAGDVRIFGERLYTLSVRKRAHLLRRTGMLFQQDALFGSLSVLENVMLPLRELTRLPAPVMTEMARMKLALVGLAALGNRLPAELSGGQRKRVGLARASVMDPRIIFCDEPTAALDPIVAAQLDQTLLRFRDVLGITIVAVTHDLNTIETISDRAIMLGRGRILAVGTVAELHRSDNPDVYRFFHRLPPETPAARGDQ